jgi:hypothetical protein
MSHLSKIEECDINYQNIDDKEFEKIETEYFKYQIGKRLSIENDKITKVDMKNEKIKSELFDGDIAYFYILIFRIQGEQKGLNHAISYLMTDDNRFIEINHHDRGLDPIIIEPKLPLGSDPISYNKVEFLENTYVYNTWHGGIIYKGIPEQQVSLRDVYKRVVIHTADFDMGRDLIKGDYFKSTKPTNNTMFPGSCTGITETIFHMLSPYIYENDYMSNINMYNKHIDYKNMFYNSDIPTRRKSTKSRKPTKKKSRRRKSIKKKSRKPTKKKSSRFSFTRVTSRRRKSAKKKSRKPTKKKSRKPTKKKSRRFSFTRVTSREPTKKKSRRFSFTRVTSRRRKSIN